MNSKLLIAFACLATVGSAVARDERGNERHKQDADDHVPVVAQTCYPSDQLVISAAGVQGTVTPSCATGSLVVSVSGVSNPWDQGLNPTMLYSNDAYPPVVLSLATYSIKAGQLVAFTCTGGITNGGGLPATGCEGVKGYFPPNNDIFQPACGTYYPSAYADHSTYPIYVFQVMGVFATAGGVVVGKPFPISSTPVNVTVPTGAVNLQLGMNDCLNRDNSPAPLTVKLAF